MTGRVRGCEGLGWVERHSGSPESWCLRRLIRLLIALSISTCAYGEQHSIGMSPAPVWSVDLISNIRSIPIEHYWEDREQSGIDFLDDERLLVHHVDQDTRQLSSRLSPDISSPFRLRAEVLSASDGVLLVTREWATRAKDSAVVIHGGGVMVRTGDTLRLLTRDFDEVRRFPLPKPLPRNERSEMYEWDIYVSASQKSVLLNNYQINYGQKVDLSAYSVLDSNSLDLKDAWNDEPSLHHLPFSLSDNAIAYVKSVHNRDQVFISEFGSGKWKTLWRRPGQSWFAPSVFTLLREDSFVYVCKEFSFISGGKVMMREPFDRGEQPVNAKVSVAKGGRFVAISLHRVRLGDSAVSDRLSKLYVVVYDLARKRRIYSAVISPLPKCFFDFALSPDGSRLAILNDQNVSVYQVPDRSVETVQADASAR